VDRPDHMWVLQESTPAYGQEMGLKNVARDQKTLDSEAVTMQFNNLSGRQSDERRPQSCEIPLKIRT
jgi:hypothetical protein